MSTQTTAPPETALALIETITAVELFERLDAKSEKALVAAAMFAPGALDLIISKIEEEVRKQAAALEISTEKQRRALASLANKVARSKTYIDDTGKSLGENLRKQLKAINDERGPAWDRLEALQKEVRKPLTDWENLDKERVAAHERELSEIEKGGIESRNGWHHISAEAMRDRLKEIETDPRNWEEFAQRAAGVKAVAKAQILEAIATREKWDAEQAELARLRAEEAERAMKEREQAAARAATEAAEKKAREAAEAAQRTAQAEQQRVERERLESEERAKRAEEQRVAAEERAARQKTEAEEWHKAEMRRIEQEALEAAAQAKRDQEAAVERERQRVAAEAEKERIAAEKREANKRHKAKIEREAMKGLVDHAQMDRAAAVVVVDAIAKGLIPHTAIEY